MHKKIIAFLLIFCVMLGMVSAALAAGPKITQQPESATTDEKGTVTFKLKATGYKGVTWRFVNPETGEETPGKKLGSLFKEIKISGVNKISITLRHVPAEMHGWYVYCHLTGNGYEVDSERVQLLVYGMPAPSDAQTADPAESTITIPTSGENGAETETLPPETPDTPAETQPSGEGTAQTPEPETQMHIDENGNLVEGAAEEIKTITIRGKDVTLYPIDSYNNLIEEEAAAELTFEGSASLAVRADGEVRYWELNGVRLEPEESVTGFVLRNITSDTTITAVLANKPAQQIDEGNMVNVTCEGCKFTWSSGGLKNVTSGQVPAGAEILIIANPAPASGYSINGGMFEDAGKMSVRRVITEDSTIIAK